MKIDIDHKELKNIASAYLNAIRVCNPVDSGLVKAK